MGTPLYNHSADMRLILTHDAGRFKLLLDHTTVLLNGDQLAVTDTVIDQTVSNDDRRWMDLTWNIDRGGRHNAFHRLDRLAVQWQPGDWGITLGRQAVSWGSGLVFQPMDLFSPFSPTVVDRDYKAGDDLLLVDRLLPNGHDLQLLHIVRRNPGGGVSAAAASTAFKWHGYLGAAEFEWLGARHFDEPVVAVSVRLPLGTALLRSDLVASKDNAGDWVYSGIVNADYTFTLGGRNAYLFAEYFYNGWGVDELQTPLDLPEELQLRLERGEVFNLMQHYLAVGGSYEWHPLVRQSTTLISNLQDSSSLLQIQLSYQPGDNQSVDLGWVEPLGRPGDEFGGVGLASLDATTGGASRAYLRWVYFF